MEENHSSEQAVSTGQAADILLVEDDAIHANVALSALNRCGFAHRTEHVTDGAEALDYIASVTDLARGQTSIPKLILLDLVLPKIGGLQVLRQLKTDVRTKSIPIVVLTSSKVAIELLESYKLGVNSYVIKPEDPAKFAELIAEISHYWLTINEAPPSFRGVMSSSRVVGPIVVTYTGNDVAVGILYPIASLIAGQIAAGLGDADDPFGGLGRNGAQKRPCVVLPSNLAAWATSLARSPKGWPLSRSRTSCAPSSTPTISPGGSKCCGADERRSTTWSVSATEFTTRFIALKSRAS